MHGAFAETTAVAGTQAIVISTEPNRPPQIRSKLRLKPGMPPYQLVLLIEWMGGLESSRRDAKGFLKWSEWRRSSAPSGLFD